MYKTILYRLIKVTRHTGKNYEFSNDGRLNVIKINQLIILNLFSRARLLLLRERSIFFNQTHAEYVSLNLNPGTRDEKTTKIQGVKLRRSIELSSPHGIKIFISAFLSYKGIQMYLLVGFLSCVPALRCVCLPTYQPAYRQIGSENGCRL